MREFTAADKYVEDDLEGYQDVVEEVLNPSAAQRVAEAPPKVEVKQPEHKIHINHLVEQTKTVAKPPPVMMAPPPVIAVPQQVEMTKKQNPNDHIQSIKAETLRLAEQKRKLEEEISSLRQFINNGQSLIQTTQPLVAVSLVQS